MDSYELDVVRKAIEHALLAAAPGLSEMSRLAIVNHATLRIRRQLNVPPATMITPR